MSQRLFVALPLPAPVQARLGQIIAQLRGALPRQSVRWVNAKALHLTLRFYGEVETEQIADIQTTLTKVTQGIGPLHLDLDQLGVFPTAVQPRVVWAGLLGDLEPLRALHQAVETGARAQGFKAETRPFRPHVTLGRVNALTAQTKQALSAIVKTTPFPTSGRFVVNELTLLKSDLKPSGPVYTPLFSAPLLEGTRVNR